MKTRKKNEQEKKKNKQKEERMQRGKGKVGEKGKRGDIKERERVNKSQKEEDLRDRAFWKAVKRPDMLLFFWRKKQTRQEASDVEVAENFDKINKANGLVLGYHIIYFSVYLYYCS